MNIKLNRRIYRQGKEICEKVFLKDKKMEKVKGEIFRFSTEAPTAK